MWRISGPEAGVLLQRLAGQALPRPRRATRAWFRDPDGTRIDDGIMLWFPGPNSATGEDVAELHVHGSRAVGDKLGEVLTRLGALPAEPGEFTLRSFRAGKMDLLEVEALGDLLNAETDSQHRQAVAGLGGQASRQVAQWREQLLSALGLLAAGIDFPDEDDIEQGVEAKALPLLEALTRGVRAEVDASTRGRKVVEGLRLVIVGPPNAGKSTLLNRLVGEERAIVSEIAGTTRDAVSARLQVAGRLVEVVDTAGLRDETDDAIEQAGMARSRDLAASADIVVAVRRADDPATAAVETQGIVLRVASQIDRTKAKTNDDDYALSAVTGEGWAVFLTALEETVRHLASPAIFAHERQRLLLIDLLQILETAGHSSGSPAELLSEDLRSAVFVLDHLGGRIGVEDVLGEVFSSFCVGK